MASVENELITLPFMRRVPVEAIRAAASWWAIDRLEPGQVLWEQSAPVDELAIVISGELSAILDGVEVGKVLPAELVGEASAFLAGAIRSATLKARKDTVLLSLPVHGLKALRWLRSPVYDCLLEQALLALVRRIRATDARIAQVALGGQSAPVRTEPSALVRFWKALRPGGPRTSCPPLEPLLCRQPVLKDAEPELIVELARCFAAETVEEGQILFLEGETGAAAYVIAEGAVDVLRHVRGQKAELLATLKTGDQFGVNTLVERGARTASCVAATPGWLYRMDAEVFASIKGDARLVWRECVLASLASQIRNANQALQRAQGKTPPGSQEPKGNFDELLKASGYLQGLSVNESELESMEVVISEDQRRNPKNRK
jgi:CRP-like cAMP-binding protein